MAKEKKGTAVRRFLDSIPYQIILCIVNIALQYVAMELFLGDDPIQIGWMYGCRNMLLLALAHLILLGLVHRLRYEIWISDALIGIWGLANYLVDSFRGYGIIYGDIYALGTVKNVAGQYSLSVSTPLVQGVLVLLMAVMLGVIAPDKTTWDGRVRRYTSRFAMVGGVVCLLCGVGGAAVVSQSTVFWEDVEGLTWDHSIGMKDYGYLLYFVANAGDDEVDIPDEYSRTKAETMLEEYQKKADQYNQNLSDDRVRPNVIMIMDESFADLSIYGDLGLDEDPLENYHALAKEGIAGMAESSVYGGYTANSEFEFLTGCSKAFLPGSPYLQYIHERFPSIVDLIKAQGGYDGSIGMHPYHSSGYNREKIYPWLGMDRSMFLDDFQGAQTLRGFVSDQADFEKIEELLEQKTSGKSLCLFNVTMQNHNPYTKTWDGGELVDIRDVTRADSQSRQYLSLARETDRALGSLVEYLKGIDEPTILVLFGDHQPHLEDYYYKAVYGKSPDEMDREEKRIQYQVPYLIWSNYDLTGQSTTGTDWSSEDLSNTSINYLSSIMMDMSGMKLSAWQCFLLEQRKHLPVVSANSYLDENGKVHFPYEVGHEYRKMMDTYEILQYYYMFDEDRSDMYFTVRDGK